MVSLVFRDTNLFTAAASVCGVTLEPTRPTPPSVCAPTDRTPPPVCGIPRPPTGPPLRSVGLRWALKPQTRPVHYKTSQLFDRRSVKNTGAARRDDLVSVMIFYRKAFLAILCHCVGSALPRAVVPAIISALIAVFIEACSRPHRSPATAMRRNLNLIHAFSLCRFTPRTR